MAQSFVDTLWDQAQEYVVGLNNHCKKSSVNNIYSLEIVDGGEPLKAGGSTIKHYKTLEYKVNTADGDFLLYIAHAPIKNDIEASKNKKWLLQLLRDFFYQCMTNYSIMSQAAILEKEGKLRKTKEEVKQIGSMVKLDGKPLTVKK